MRSILIAAAVALLGSGAAAAQDLPALGKAPEIVTGKLPDGISYYLVNNTAFPGFADFALVQPMRTDRSGPRKDLVSLPHFYGRKPYKFLIDNGVGYGRRGFIEFSRNSTVFRFADVPVSRPEVTDSTLLMLFDMARSSKYEQAIVVSGNIDVAAVLERIRILSMTISRRKSVEDTWNYEWKPREDAIVTSTSAPVGTVSLSYRSPRFDRERMNTIQPVMSRLLAMEMDKVLGRRMRAAFSEAGIPLADYSFSYIGSEATSGDEQFIIRFHTAPDKLEQAVRVAAGVLSTLDEEGPTVEEVEFARTEIAEMTRLQTSRVRTPNDEYLDKCIASYLYGSNLSASSELSSVFTGLRLEPKRECELLGNYISSIISPDRNLYMRVGAPVRPDGPGMLAAFKESWESGYECRIALPEPSDTVLLEGRPRKVKLKTTARDTFTGGKLWTFSNGISVIYKQTADKGTFQYGMMIKGGWPEISAISGSEPAFADEVLRLGMVSGLSNSHVTDLLTANGIVLNPRVTMTDVRFVGQARSSSLSLLLKVLASYANNYSPDPEEYQRYLAEKRVRLARDKYYEGGIMASLDSTLCPKYEYVIGSMPDLPPGDFNFRLSQYLSKKTSNMKSAVIVLVGDLNENVALKILCNNLGAFRTGQQRTMRPRMPYPLRTCWSTVATEHEWRNVSVNVAMESLWPFGPEGSSQMNLACTLLQAELDKALMSEGMFATVSGRFDMLPAERFRVHVRCEPIPAICLPADVSPAMPLQTLATVRTVINRLATTEMDKNRLDLCKEILINWYKADENLSEMLRDAVLDRSSVGQDLRSGFAQRIKAVTPEEIQKIFASLLDSTAEYVVQ